uniref:hypothetical protein n=1 Tax=Stappia sp. TaxID=1870903 RepID=UPI003BAAA20B
MTASSFNPRDKSRTAVSKTDKMREQYRSPPRTSKGDLGQAWIWLTEDLISSPAFRTLSLNAYRVFFRILAEYLQHGRTGNGDLIVTHADFQAAGASQNLIADAIEELTFKGLIQVRRGRAADGTPHPNRFRITYLGTDAGEPWSNEWKGVTEERAGKWAEERDKKRADRQIRRKRRRREKISPLTEQRISHSLNSESSPKKREEAA